MGPGYFVIAILGCADGGSACTPVATLQTRYASAGAMLGGDRPRRSRPTASSISRRWSRAAAPGSAARRARPARAADPGKRSPRLNAGTARRAAGFARSDESHADPSPRCRAAGRGKTAAKDEHATRRPPKSSSAKAWASRPRSKRHVRRHGADDPRGQLPGHESQLEPKPDWEPRYPGSGPPRRARSR